MGACGGRSASRRFREDVWRATTKTRVSVRSATRHAPRFAGILSENRYLSFSLRLDLVEHGQHPLEFVVEEPHRIENIAEGGRCPGPVSPSEGQNAVVPQISHDRRIGDLIRGQIA